MTNETIMNAIYEEANKYGFGMSVEEMASKIYHALTVKGCHACIVNERYISWNGLNYAELFMVPEYFVRTANGIAVVKG